MAGRMVVVTAGRGPVECEIAAALIARELAREAEAAGLSVASDLGEADRARSILLVIGGDGAQAFLRGWIGAALWIDGEVRAGRSRRNWYVGVHEVPDAVEPPALDVSQVRFEAMRAGGPGGQHQNVTESAVRAVHVPTGLSAVSRDARSQHRNRKAALDRLAEIVAASADAARRERARAAWMARIEVRRGDPVRTYAGRPPVRR